MFIEKIIEFLDCNSNDPDLRSLLLKNGIDLENELTYPEDDYSTYISRNNKGLSLIFKTFESDLDEGIEGRLFLSGIFVYNSNVQDFSKYTGELPFCINFGDYREALINKIGVEPNWKLEYQGKLNAERWVKNNVKINITYGSNNIEFICFQKNK